MDILAALKQEEAKWEKQAEEARQQLETVRAAMKLFRGETGQTDHREETSDVCRCESEDFEGIKRAVGKV
jgi:type II secretory pathway pseudopilin PulG